MVLVCALSILVFTILLLRCLLCLTQAFLISSSMALIELGLTWWTPECFWRQNLLDHRVRVSMEARSKQMLVAGR